MTDQLSLNANAPLFQPKKVSEEVARVVKPRQQKKAQKVALQVNFLAGSDDEAKEETQDQSPKEFAFPDGGWECSMCNNYNFKLREKCFRCKKDRDSSDFAGKPKHIRKMETKKAKAKLSGFSGETPPRPQFNSMPQNYGMNQQESMGGDWACQRCFNRNQSFKEQCNQCYLSQIESNSIAQQRLHISQQQVSQQYYQQQQPMMQGQMSPEMQQQMMYAQQQQQQQMQYQSAMHQQKNQMMMQQMNQEAGPNMQSQQGQYPQNGNNGMGFQQTGSQMFAPLPMQMQAN